MGSPFQTLFPLETPCPLEALPPLQALLPPDLQGQSDFTGVRTT